MAGPLLFSSVRLGSCKCIAGSARQNRETTHTIYIFDSEFCEVQHNPQNTIFRAIMGPGEDMSNSEEESPEGPSAAEEVRIALARTDQERDQLERDRLRLESERYVC